MRKEVSVTVLDVGSGKICGIVASQLEGDDFNVLAQAEVACPAFYAGKWLNEEDVSQAIASVLKQLQSRTDAPLNKVFVGVPGEFASVVTKQGETVFLSPKKITQESINEVFESADRFTRKEGYSAISRSSIYFNIDDDRRVIDPVGEEAKKLSGLISFIFVDDVFKNLIVKALKENNVKEFDFIPQSLAQSLYLIRPAVRDGFAVLVDCGFVSTCVSVILGDGILYARSFSAGGGNMCGDLCEVFGIEFDEAVRLMPKLHLSLAVPEGEVFAVGNKNIDAAKANEVVRCRVEDIAEKINLCLQGCPHKLPNNLPIFVTGGAFANLKGGISELSKFLNRQACLATMNAPQFERQEYTSVYSLIGIALSQSRPQKKAGFFKKLLSGLGG